MSLAETVGEQRVLLRSVRWETYLTLVEESEQAGGRMTYDQGLLEIMTPSMPLETAGSLLGRMVERFTEIRTIEIRTVASTTFRRSDLKRGFEADESYYIQHAADIRGLREIDLSIHPPPDLVIEIELTRSAIDKLPLFASMGIPEVWRYDGQSLWVGTRQQDGYQEITDSRVLSGFPIALARDLLAVRLQSSETELIRRFVSSVEP